MRVAAGLLLPARRLQPQHAAGVRQAGGPGRRVPDQPAGGVAGAHYHHQQRLSGGLEAPPPPVSRSSEIHPALVESVRRLSTSSNIGTIQLDSDQSFCVLEGPAIYFRPS